MKQQIKHFIFDLDGTLSNTAAATADAIKDAQAKFNLPDVTGAQIRNAMGLHGLEFHMNLFSGMTAEQLRPVEKAIDVLEMEHIVKRGRGILFPGVYEMLESLCGAGCFLYIASTGNNEHVETTLEATGITRFFTAVRCNEPQKISMVKDLIGGQDKQEWAMIGDMFKDAEAARGNGILALGAGFGYLKEKDIPLFDAVLAKPHDIFTYVP